MPGDLEDLEKRINEAKSRDDNASHSQEKENNDRSTGMRAGSEFMGYIFAGGVVGWGIGHFFGNTALWLILMLFIGFGWGIYRAYLAMNAKS